MANPEHVARLKKGVWEWNGWYEEQARSIFGSERPDLAGAELNGLDLEQVKLPGADLTSADLRYTCLDYADLEQACLLDIELENAILNRANLSYADLRGARLVSASILGANLRGCNLRGVNLTSATVGYTILSDVDLTGVDGLTTVNHYAPSSIDIDTIIRSKGQIPEIFLRGCGVPEPFIVQMKTLVGAMDPIQFYSVFISYSSHDQEFAERSTMTCKPRVCGAGL
jgi:hypothetical protein